MTRLRKKSKRDRDTHRATGSSHGELWSHDRILSRLRERALALVHERVSTAMGCGDGRPCSDCLSAEDPQLLVLPVDHPKRLSTIRDPVWSIHRPGKTIGPERLGRGRLIQGLGPSCCSLGQKVRLSLYP